MLLGIVIGLAIGATGMWYVIGATGPSPDIKEPRTWADRLVTEALIESARRRG